LKLYEYIGYFIPYFISQCRFYCDFRSHVCWHVYGLLHRSNRDYNEAIKAYKQALRIDVDNLQILRDLSMLQVQMRDLDGFAVTRHNILTLKSNGKINWLAFALAKHLTGDLRGAISVIDIYLGTLAEDAPERTRGFEASELAMYKNQILAEIPDNYQEALDHLAECEQIVVDRTSWITSKCKYQLRLGKFTDAKTTTMEMFERGMTENFKVHNMYMCAVLELDETTCEEAFELPGTRTLATHFPLTAEQKKIILEGYRTELFPLYEKSHAMQRVCMNLVEEDRFISSLDVFMRKQLVKGVPSLCNELSTFLLTEKNGRIVLETDPALVKKHATFKLIVGLVDGYLSCLTEKSKLLPGDESNEPPSTFLWTWYLRAGLHEMAAEYVEGIAFLDKCLEHTPTAVDVYELKARLLKKAGDIDAAVECIDKGRDLDRQDRYINNQTTRYMLQAGKEEEASNRISMFTKHEGNPEQNLYDMQCSWYELELAACLYRKEEWGRSLKKYCKYHCDMFISMPGLFLLTFFIPFTLSCYHQTL
jgi:N-alpha-acetyltransferase 15/16, NatA auxiliary subunit